MNASANLAPRPRMNADEFLAWAMEMPGRYELVHGEVVAMSPERSGHAIAKTRTIVALSNAVAAAGLPCTAYADGMAVLVADDVIFEPDAMLRCGPRLPSDALMVTDPIILVEVLSPSTRHVDTGKKLTGYFGLPSVAHYLVLDPQERTVLHYRREGDGIGLRVLAADAEGGPEIALDPPGLSVRCADLFEAP